MAGQRTIVVADDDDEIRECISMILQDEGFAVRPARNGRDALAVLGALGDDECALVLDLMMPVMSGFEVLDVLVREGRLARLPVIVCSAMAKERPLAEGVRVVLTKPLEFESLIAAVERVCGMQQSGVRLTGPISERSRGGAMGR